MKERYKERPGDGGSSVLEMSNAEKEGEGVKEKERMEGDEEMVEEGMDG